MNSDLSRLPTKSYAVPGLAHEVEILIDRWGVPHIYAPDRYSAYLAQGFNAARDRLWQIDLWRKRGLGELARDFGPAYAEQDRAARLFLYRGDMRAEWLAYHSDTKRIVEAFVAGINAYVALTRSQPDLLPPEFHLLAYQPSFWEPADVVRIRSNGAATNLPSEVARSRVAAVSAVAWDQLRRIPRPAWDTTIPDGLNPADIPEAVLKVYNLAREGVSFTPEKLRGAAAASPDALAALRQALDRPLSESNNFAIAPSRSTTGRPILASDPHRNHSVPSLRYLVHLSAPGLDIIGAGEPALPGIALGHNGTVAVGITRFYIDQEDLHFYETNPANPGEYRYQGRWEPFRVITETLAIKGEPARAIELKFTRHGPVLFEDPASHRAYAGRIGPLEPGMAPFLAGLEYMQAKNWDDFLAAINRHGMPSLNYLYADTAGNIGWRPAGLAPIRPNWDGFLPVPGDGRYEWQGFRTTDEMPVSFNPAGGWLGSANEMNIPEGHPLRTKLGFEWDDPCRAIRLKQIFDGDRKFGVNDMVQLQADLVNTTGQRMTALLRHVQAPAGSPAATALGILLKWDHRSHRDSAGAAVFNVWYHRHVRPALMRQVVPPAALPIIASGDPAFPVDFLEKPDARLGPEPIRAREDFLLATLASAAAELVDRLGADPAQWTWGRLHHALFVHPLASALPDSAEARRLNVGPLPKSGDNETLCRSMWDLANFRLVNGASMRFVADVGNWDNSWANNSPGQSGDPRSPHYRDLFADWVDNKFFPLVYSRAAVEKAATARILLTPG